VRHLQQALRREIDIVIHGRLKVGGAGEV
jgi:hypothetical protein